MMWLVNRLVGAVVGLTLAAAGIVVVVEAVRFLTGGAPVLIPVEDWAAGESRLSIHSLASCGIASAAKASAAARWFSPDLGCTSIPR